MLQEPTTPDEWRRAVTLAEVCLDLDAARRYGLVTGGPDVDVERCVDLLKRGRQRGVVPVAAAVNAATQAFVRDLCDRR